MRSRSCFFRRSRRREGGSRRGRGNGSTGYIDGDGKALPLRLFFPPPHPRLPHVHTGRRVVSDASSSSLLFAPSTETRPCPIPTILETPLPFSRQRGRSCELPPPTLSPERKSDRRRPIAFRERAAEQAERGRGCSVSLVPPLTLTSSSSLCLHAPHFPLGRVDSPRQEAGRAD